MNFNGYINKTLIANTAMVCSFAVAVAAPSKEKAAQRPNVIFFLVDDLGWSDIACFGSNFHETPNIDRLSQEGVRFTDAYTTCHVSSPARASIMTGRYPASINMTDWLPGRREFPFQRLKNVEVTQDLPADEVTIAETLRESGYRTAMIGKWHLGETGSTPEEHGFESHIPHGYLKGWPSRGYMAPFGMNGFDGEPGEYLTDRLTTEALNYIEKNSKEPFFLMLSHFAVHDPIEGRADLVEKYTKKLKSLPKSELPPFILEGNPDDPNSPSAEELLSYLDNPTYAPHKVLPNRLVKIKQIQDNVQFAAMVESMDQSMGRIMDKLKQLGIDDNTIIVFFADNGGMSAANYGGPNRIIQPNQLDVAYSSSMLPLRGGKGWLYEGGLRVPMVIKAPRNVAGTECNTPVVSVDFYPTLLSMTSTPMPANSKAEGVDISPLIQKKKIAERPIFWHFPHYSNHGMQSPSGAVRLGDYKLIEYYENNMVQLFNLKTDIEERYDISKKETKKVAQLKGMLDKWRKDVDAKMPIPNSTYDARIDTKWAAEVYPDRWWSLFAQYDGGLMGDRVELWRNNRLWYVTDQNFLLAGFDNRPGAHVWQGEHVGKWLHAASLAYNHNKDPKLKAQMDLTVDRLLKSQLVDGYMGTYATENTFVAKPEDASPDMWDVWTHRYNIYGLLSYESFFPNETIVDACRKMGDLLIKIYGDGAADLTKNGTREGMSSTTLLESIVMLYERTGDERYLDFAKDIVEMSERNPNLSLLSRMLSDDPDVVKPGNGKVYQLLSNLLGYFRLYQVTGDERYSKAVYAAWSRVHKQHLLTTGGVWSRATDYNGNKECFAYKSAFNPEQIVVENCSNVTWIQLCLQLFDYTGMRKYLDDAEVCMYNDLFGHQHNEGIDGCYYTCPNQTRPPFVDKIHCCASSSPRAMELMVDHIAGEIDNILSVNIMTPSKITLGSKFGGGNLVISGNYPFGNSVQMKVDIDAQPHIYKEYTIEFRVPLNTDLTNVQVNGQKVNYTTNKRGYIGIQRQWAKGDVIDVSLQYQFNAVVQTGENGDKWVAFTYGPIALAQKISTQDSLEPFLGMKISEQNGAEFADRFMMSVENGVPQFKLKDSDLVLIPYCYAGSKKSGPKTYFKL